MCSVSNNNMSQGNGGSQTLLREREGEPMKAGGTGLLKKSE